LRNHRPNPSGHSGDEARRILINGRRTAAIDVEDRGLLYGDGIFETIAVRGGRPCLWARHLARLSAGARRLGFAAIEPRRLAGEARSLLDGGGDGTLKLMLTRGPGPRGYRPPARPQPTRILIHYPAASVGAEPMQPTAVRYCRTPLGSNPALAGIKHLNRLEQVLARAEWQDPRIAEGLMSDGDGNLTCGTMTNLFMITDNRIQTPLLDRAGVSGTVRGLVVEQARALGISIMETRLRRADLARADGAFLTNALIGLRIINRTDERELDPAAVPRALCEAVQRAALQPETDW
jgi:4-amino-4-deoxychorismate lyase